MAILRREYPTNLMPKIFLLLSSFEVTYPKTLVQIVSLFKTSTRYVLYLKSLIIDSVFTIHLALA